MRHCITNFITYATGTFLIGLGVIFGLLLLATLAFR